MKRLFLYCFAAIVLTACVNQLTEESEQPKQRITFNVVQTEKQPLSRAALGDACSVLDYYRVTDGVVAATQHQTLESQTFGTIADEMEWGTHHLYFVGHKQTITNFSNGVASFDKVSDTFTHYLQLVVNDDSEATQAVELTRSVAKFELVATDALPEGLAALDIVITGANNIVDVETQLAATQSTVQKRIEVPAANIGKRNCTFSAYMFLTDTDSEVDIAITALDSNDDELLYIEFEDVEMSINYITRYKGQLFDMNTSMAVTVNSDWADTNETLF